MADGRTPARRPARRMTGGEPGARIAYLSGSGGLVPSGIAIITRRCRHRVPRQQQRSEASRKPNRCGHCACIRAPFAAARPRLSGKTRPVMCGGDGASNGTSRRSRVQNTSGRVDGQAPRERLGRSASALSGRARTTATVGQSGSKAGRRSNASCSSRGRTSLTRSRPSHLARCDGGTEVFTRANV